MNSFKAQDRQSHEQDLSLTFDNMVLSNPEAHKCASSAIESYSKYSSLALDALNEVAIDDQRFKETKMEKVLVGLVSVSIATLAYIGLLSLVS